MTDYVIHVEPLEIKITIHPVGLTVEGNPNDPKGRRLDSSPASGGRIASAVGSSGDFSFELEGPLDVGRDGERHVLKVLAKALADRGDTVSQVPGAQDSRGEDGRFLINGTETVVQIVSVPADPSIWAELASASGVTHRGTLADAVVMVRSAFEKKRGRVSGALLALDASCIGAIVTPRLVDAYLREFECPETELGVTEAWLIGPTVRSTFRFEGE